MLLKLCAKGNLDPLRAFIYAVWHLAHTSPLRGREGCQAPYYPVGVGKANNELVDEIVFCISLLPGLRARHRSASLALRHYTQAVANRGRKLFRYFRWFPVICTANTPLAISKYAIAIKKPP